MTSGPTERGLQQPAVKSRKRGRPPSAERREDDGDRASNGIRAMVVGLSVLRAVGLARRPQPLREIAAASGLMPSRVHRYLSSLVAAGYVRQDPESGHYALGEATVEIGLLALGQIDAIAIGTEALQSYGELSGLDGHLSVWGSHGPTVVRWRAGRQGMQIKIEEGRILPVLWTATGRLLAAYRDMGDIAPLLGPELESWNREHPDQPLDSDEVDAVLADIREKGFSSALATAGGGKKPPVALRSENHAFDTLAVPLFDHLGQVRMALTFFGTERFALSGQNARVDELVEIGRAASRKLGYHSKVR